MSSKYIKISQTTKDGLDGTKHVTRLRDVPGLTRFTDKPVLVSPPKIEAMKHKSSPARVSVDSFKENKTVSSFSDSLNNVSNRNDPKGSTDFDEEVDVNSAVRKAIEKAQESIRIAKESVGRKKKGLQNFSNKTFKDSFKVEGTSSQVFPAFKDGKKLLVVKKVIDEINEKISESTKECLIPVQSCNIYKDEYETLCSDEVDRETTKTETLDAAHEEQAYNMFYKGKMKVVGTMIDVLEHQNLEEEHQLFERVDVDTLRESKENKDEVVSQGSYQNDSEKLEEVLEQKDVENVKSDKGGEEVLELFENENEFEDDHDTKIHDGEGTSEMFCDDFEMTQEDNITDESKGETLDEFFDQEFNVKSAGDDKVSEEIDNIDGIYVGSNIVDMYDNIVETTQDVDDVTEDKESMEGADASEVCEKTSMDQNVSDEDEYEVTSKVNDARCVKTDMEEPNKQKNIIDNLAAENDENANEIKDSLESRYRDKEDETEEPGPSNVSGQDHFRRIYEEAAAKERERVRNRSVVERAISEARERAYAEARERAERQRADVKKAIEEARKIKMAAAGEKVAKASVASRSAQSKHRAKRATVERPTSEACQRALEKAISQKTVSDSNSFKSALRTKAKLEMQNRILERAAKTIAEKEKRDRLAQKEKEQAERNHLAVNLDAEIKRWSNGKEGNLRALLSTLQYILGPESGWQPVSLTHSNTTSDVKKAYRKATLCVHPDKLQQWGANIQHKYICEKVFDLLKAAWKRFNSEER